MIFLNWKTGEQEVQTKKVVARHRKALVMAGLSKGGLSDQNQYFLIKNLAVFVFLVNIGLCNFLGRAHGRYVGIPGVHLGVIWGEPSKVISEYFVFVSEFRAR